MSMYTWRDIREVVNIREIDNIREYTSYAIQSQYSASKKIMSICAQYQENIDPSIDIDLFYNKIFNIYTAEGVGLDNWGEILQISREIVDDEKNESITLNDEYYRLQLLYKALSNISASTANSQNRLLNILVQTDIRRRQIPAYVIEIDTMVIRWVFETVLDDLRRIVFKNVGTLARGAGVGWELYAIDPTKVFGFDGSGMNPFNQAPFAPDNALIANRGDSVMPDPMSGTIMLPEVFSYSGSQVFTLSKAPKFIIEALILKDDTLVYLEQEGDYTVTGNYFTINSPVIETGEKVKITYAV